MAQKDEDRKPVDLSTLTLDQLPKNLLADLHSQWEASQNGADGDGMSEVVDLEAARTAMAAEMEAQLKAEYTRMQEASAKMLKGLIAEMRHEGQIIELAQDLTTPSEQSPHTLPVTGEAMQTFLKSLTQPQLDQARAIFGAIQRDGLVEFEAIGHGKTKTGTIQLESHVKSLLRSHLADGGDMDEFFEVAGIGDRKDFDLSEFTEEK